jgi:hypothetical protein
MQQNLIALMTVFGVALFNGCGGGPGDTPELGQVDGKVTLDAKPLDKATVTFRPEEGRPSSGTTDSEGHYTLQYSTSETGAKVGKNTVSISTAQAEPEEEDCSKVEYEEESVDPIPPKYNTESANNPDMTVEVKPGENTFNFDLKSDGTRKASGRRPVAPDPCACE